MITIGMSVSVHADDAQPGVPAKKSETQKESYVPGMGEIMAATQMRHSKLWFAGKSANWELASYELDEIEEGLDGAVKYHPVFKKDAPIATILAKFTAPPLRDIKAAIAAKDKAAFRKSFAALTHACNACHQAASQGFIVIKQPNLPPADNQDFSVKSTLSKSK